MLSARLPLALSEGLLPVPPEGRIAVFGAGALDDLSALPAARVTVVQGFRPDHDALGARGLHVTPGPAEGPFAAAVVCLPRARAAAGARIAAAMAAVVPGGPVLVDGQKHDGIEAALAACRARATVAGPISKAHGKCFALAADATAFADLAARPRTIEGGFVTLPGVFSADGPDPGSALLAAHLPAGMAGRVADLGGGWGYLGRAVLARDGVARLDLVEADHDALACARENLAGDPRAHLHWADATAPEALPAGAFDWVVTNPPFHTGRAADPALGRAFLHAAARLLAPHGTALIVANTRLPYEATLAEAFAEIARIAEAPGYKLLAARRPVAARAPRGRRPRPTGVTRA